MITTRREVSDKLNTYVTEQDRNLAVNSTFAERTMSGETISDAERTRKNLEYIMNYDRYIVTEREEAVARVADAETDVVKDEVIAPEKEEAEVKLEDIEPSSTTMQFLNESTTELMGDIKKEKKEAFHLTRKAKVMIALYAFAVTVIMALIVLNTTVLGNLSGMIKHKTSEYQSLKTSYEQVMDELENVSDEETIAEKATEFGMIK